MSAYPTLRRYRKGAHIHSLNVKLEAREAHIAVLEAPRVELKAKGVAARDFELSKRFYEEVGFEKLLDAAIFGVGMSGFILQDRFEKEWAENFMMQLMVDV